MKRTLVIIFFLLRSATLLADYQLFYENGKAGIRDESGKVVIPAAYDALGWSDGSFSIVNQVTGYRSQSKWGLINLRKELVTKADFENLTSTGGDRIIASRWINPYTKKFGCLDLYGNVTVPFNYDGINIIGLRGVVCVKNAGRYEYGLIDLNDKSVISIRYRDVHPIGSLRFAVQDFNKKTALFSEEGLRLTEFSIDSISSFRSGNAIIYQNLLQGLIDREGLIVKEPVYRSLKIESDGNVTGKTCDEWILIDQDNHELKSLKADELLPGKNGYQISMSGRSGTVDRDLNPRIPLVYERLGPFQNGMAVVKSGKKYGVIRLNGSTVIPMDHDSLVMEDNFLRSQRINFGEPEWAVYDTFGIRKTEKRYDRVDRFNGKYFPVWRNDFCGAVDRYGKEILACVYDSLGNYNYDGIVVRFKGLYGIVDFGERWIIHPQADPLVLVSDQLYLHRTDTISFIKDFSGQIIYFTGNSLRLDGDHFEEQMANGALKHVSFTGISTYQDSPPLIDNTVHVFEESEGLRGIERDGQFGFIDERGRLRVANRYEDIGKFSQGLAAVKIVGKWGFVNKEDQIVINPNFEKTSPFVNGVSVVQRNGKAGAISLTGSVILPMRYDSVRLLANTLVIHSEGKAGLARIDGHVLLEPRFDHLEVVAADRVIIRNGDAWGVVTLDGLPVIPMIYRFITYDNAVGMFLAKRESPWRVVIDRGANR